MRRFVGAIYVAIVICLFPVLLGAQTRSNERAAETASVSGRITSGGKPLAGLGIALQPVQTDGPPSSRSALLRSRTDAEGRYQFSGVPPGQFEFVVFSPIYVQPGDPRSSRSRRRITLGDGKNATNIDLALVRGGIVTGKITSPKGQPLIEQTVFFDWLDERWLVFYQWLCHRLCCHIPSG